MPSSWSSWMRKDPTREVDSRSVLVCTFMAQVLVVGAAHIRPDAKTLPFLPFFHFSYSKWRLCSCDECSKRDPKAAVNLSLSAAPLPLLCPTLRFDLVSLCCPGCRVCKCRDWTVDGEHCKSFFFKAEEQTAANNDGVNDRLLPCNPAASPVKAARA